MRFVLGVDLDGVVADFYEGLRPIAAEWLGVDQDALAREVTYGLPEWNLDSMGGYIPLHRFAVTQRELFKRVRPIEGAAACLRRLAESDVRVRIITHRLFIKHFHEEAVTQTVEWLEHHGVPYWDLCFMKDKAAVGADAYIEDSPQNVEQLRSSGHRTLVFTNSTNRRIEPPRADDWAGCEAWVLDEVRAWAALVKKPRISGS